jgi:hypothetical protein
MHYSSCRKGCRHNQYVLYIMLTYLCVIRTGPLCVKLGSLLTLGCFFLDAAVTTVVRIVLSTLTSVFAAIACCFTSVSTGGNSDSSASCHVVLHKQFNQLQHLSDHYGHAQHPVLS